MARPHIEPFVELNHDYKRMTLPGMPSGMHYKMLSFDTDTGACTMKARLDAGTTQKPGFSYSEIEIFVLKGKLEFGRDTCVEGHYMFIPAGVAMPAMRTVRGCELLMFYNSSEPNFVESDVDHQNAQRSKLVSVNAYEGLPWALSTKRPGVATGCLTKALRVDPRTFATTFLYCMVPEFRQDNISYHDCAEESYHIWGTSWMMQFGELPTGGYFWRPPYINHGAFASKLGTIALGRTDSELYNHFHFNPWSNVEENEERAASRLQHRNPELYNWVWARDHNHPHPHDFELDRPADHDHGHEHHGVAKGRRAAE
jgi:hypothetical protein